jgi:hypothetical protein
MNRIFYFRWYGKKIYYMLMSFDELDSMMKHYLNPTAYANMCEILDSIRAKVRNLIRIWIRILIK